MNLQEAIEKRAKAWEALKTFLDTHITADGLSADHQATYDKMEKDIENLTKTIEILQKQAELENKLNQPMSDPVTNNPADGGEENQTGRENKEYTSAFINYARNGEITNILQTTPNSDGGYLIPTEYESILIQKLTENNIFRQISRVISTMSPLKIPVEVNGTTASWTGENQKAPESNSTFKQLSLEAHKMTVRTRASIELLQDSFINIESYLIEDFGKAMGIKEEEAFCTGDGSNKPKGIFRADGGADTGVETSGAAITGDNMIDLIHSLKSPYRAKAKFVTNDSTVAQVRKLKDNQGQYLWQPSMQAGQPDRLYGYPVHTSPAVPAVAAGAFAMAFGDFDYYRIGDRMTRTVQRLIELYAENGQVGFLATSRVDGLVTLPEAIKLMKIAGGAGA